MSGLLLRLVVRWETVLVVAIIGVGIWSTTLSPFFLTRINLLDLITPYVFIGLMALGLTFVVIAGEIDISVTAILAVSVVCVRATPRPRAERLDRRVGRSRRRGRARPRERRAGGAREPASLAVTLGTLAAFQGLAFVVLPARAWPSSRRAT